MEVSHVRAQVALQVLQHCMGVVTGGTAFLPGGEVRELRAARLLTGREGRMYSAAVDCLRSYLRSGEEVCGSGVGRVVSDGVEGGGDGDAGVS